MPGKPRGIARTDSPIAAGRSCSSRRISAAGTCPSIAYPSISAVWHEPYRTGIPRRALASVLPPSWLLTSKPFASRCLTHSRQQPHDGPVQTSIAFVSVAASKGAVNGPAIAATSNDATNPRRSGSESPGRCAGSKARAVPTEFRSGSAAIFSPGSSNSYSRRLGKMRRAPPHVAASRFMPFFPAHFYLCQSFLRAVADRYRT